MPSPELEGGPVASDHLPVSRLSNSSHLQARLGGLGPSAHGQLSREGAAADGNLGLL